MWNSLEEIINFEINDKRIYLDIVNSVMNKSSSITKNAENTEFYNVDQSEIDVLLTEYQHLNPIKVDSFLNNIKLLRVYCEAYEGKDENIFSASVIGQNKYCEVLEETVDYRISIPEQIQNLKYTVKLELKDNSEYIILFTSVFTIVNYFNVGADQKPKLTRVFHIRQGKTLLSLQDRWIEINSKISSRINNLRMRNIGEVYNKVVTSSSKAIPSLIDPASKWVHTNGREFACSVNLLLNKFNTNSGEDLGFLKIWHRVVDDQYDSFVDIPGGGTGYTLNNKHLRQNGLISAIRELIEQSSYLLTLGPFSLNYFDIRTDLDEDLGRNAVYALGTISFNSQTSPLLSSLYSKQSLNYQTILPGANGSRDVFKAVDCGNEVVGQFVTSYLKSISNGFEFAKKKTGATVQDIMYSIRGLSVSISNSASTPIVEAKDYDIIKCVQHGLDQTEIESFLNFLFNDLRTGSIDQIISIINSSDEFRAYEFVNKVLNIGRTHRFRICSETQKTYSHFKNKIQAKFSDLRLNKQDKFILKDMILGCSAIVVLLQVHFSMNVEILQQISVAYSEQLKQQLEKNRLVAPSPEAVADLLRAFNSAIRLSSAAVVNSEYSRIIEAISEPEVVEIFYMCYASVLFSNDVCAVLDHNEDCSLTRSALISKTIYDSFSRPSICQPVHDTYGRLVNIFYPFQRIPEILAIASKICMKKYFSEADVLSMNLKKESCQSIQIIVIPE